MIFSSYGILIVGCIGLTIFCICSHGLPSRIYAKYAVYSTVAFAFMLILYCGLIQMAGKPYYGGDDELFEEYGKYLYSQGIFTFWDIPYIQGMWYAKGYLIFIAWIYRISELVGEYSTISPRVLNIYLWLSITVLVYKRLIKYCKEKNFFLHETVDRKQGEKYLYYVNRYFPFFVLFPNAIYIASFAYRDLVVTFFFVLSVYLFEDVYDNLLSKKGIKTFIPRILGLIGSMYVVYYTRSQMIYVLIAIYALKIFSGKKKGVSLIAGKRLIFILLGVGIAYWIIDNMGGIRLLSIISKGYSEYRAEANAGLSGRIFSLPLIPFGVILRFAYGLITPFPGGILKLHYSEEFIYSILQIVVYLGTILQIFLLPYLFKRIRKLDYESLRFLVVFGAVIVSTYTFRHFIMTYPFMVELILPEFALSNRKEKNRKFTYVFAALFFGAFVYCML